MLGADLEAPVQEARRVRLSSADTHIVFLSTPTTEAALRRELMVGRIGTLWSIAPADQPDAIADAIRRASSTAEQRRKLRRTIGRVNLQLAQPAASLRRTVISDHFLALVLEQLSDAVVVLDNAGTVLAWNATAARAFGHIQRGIAYSETLPPAAGQAIRAAYEHPEGLAESIVRSRAGTEYGVRATALRDAGGAVAGIALVARDVTASRNEERRRRLVAEAVQVLASTLDVRTALQRLADLLVSDFADLAATDIIEGETVARYAVAGHTAREREIMERIRGWDISRNRDHPSMAAITRGETVLQNDVDDRVLRAAASSEEHLAALRELLPRALLIVPLCAGEQTIGAIALARTRAEPFLAADAATVQDLARQTSTALQNIWSFQAAAQTSRLKDEFLATLSHELRTPMTAILGWSQILRMPDTAPEMVSEGLESIERSARAQSQLIDDLLDLSRMQMGKVQFQPRTFSLSGVVSAAIETVRPAALARNITIHAEIQPGVSIVGDPDRMQQVIWNLLSNAVKFSDAGSAISIAVEADDIEAVVVTTDHGRGIAPDFLPHVFDRFRQADSATTRRYGGLGLGLAIVKQLVELHGGTVKASSRGVGQGAAFTVRLPLARHPEARNARESGSAAVEAPALPDLSGIRVLIVEDDPATASAFATVLQRSGAEVRVAHSVSEALGLLRDLIPAILLSDVGMPDDDGLALIRAVRHRLRIPADRLPAVAVTAFHDLELRVHLLGEGFQRVLLKPVDAHDLASMVLALAARER